MKKLSVVIPVYNEEKFVGKLLQKVHEVDLSDIGYAKEIIIVNDGSKDKSAEIIQSFIAQHPDQGIKYLYQERQPDNSNTKWLALKNGFALASWDVFIVQDADLEYDPLDYIPLLQKLEKDKLDFIYGSRTRGYITFGARYSTFWFLLGGLAVSLLTSLLWWSIVTDEPTCYKVFTSKLKKYLVAIPENNFDREPAITMTLLKKWYKYGEIPIRYYPRPVTQGKKIKLRDGWMAIKTLFKYRFFS